jgi:putative intracellular protease/amidase
MYRILMILTSHDRLGDTDSPTGWYVPEAAHPWERFRAAGIGVDYMSPAGGTAPLTGYDDTDPVQVAFLEEYGSLGPVTMAPADVHPERYDGVFYVGGHGTMWDFPADTAMISVVQRIAQRSGVVAAVCHGPAGLLNLRHADGSLLVAGRRVAAFTNEEEEAVGLTGIVPFLLADALVERGAIHVRAANFEANIVIDGRLVTGQNPASAAGVADAAIGLLGSPAA